MLEQRSKKCFDHRGEHFNKILSLVAAGFFLSDRARDLPVLPRKELWGQNNLYVILNRFCPVSLRTVISGLNGQLCGCGEIDRLPVECLMEFTLIGALKGWISERIDWRTVWQFRERSGVRKSTSYVTCMAGCDNVLMAGW